MVINRWLGWPEAVLKSANVTEASPSSLPVKSQEFWRLYGETRESLKELDAHLTLSAREFTLHQSVEIQPLSDFADALFKYKFTYYAQRPDYSRPLEFIQTGTVTKDCNLAVGNIKTLEYLKDDRDPALTIIKITENLSSSERRVPTRELLENFEVDTTNDFDRTLSILRGPGFKFWGHDGSWSAKPEGEMAERRRVFNQSANRIELEATAWQGRLIYTGSDHTLGMRWSAASQGARTLEFQYPNGAAEVIEKIPLDLWAKSEFRKRGPSKNPWTMGFTQDDLYADKLIYHVDAHEFLKPYENASQYYQVSNAGKRLGDFQFDVVAIHREPPKALPWLGTEVPGGADTDSTSYVNLDDVKTIADGMRASLKGMDRLQVSRAIIRKTKELISPDTDMVNEGTTTSLTLKEILERKKGVCQHYSAIFQALARNLGIPTRIVYGNLIGTAEATGHVWVEVKINDDTWWPLEPQVDSDSLPSRGYFPWLVNYIYNAHNQAEYDAGAAEQVARHLEFYSFRKVSAEGTVANALVSRPGL